MKSRFLSLLAVSLLAAGCAATPRAPLDPSPRAAYPSDLNATRTVYLEWENTAVHRVGTVAFENSNRTGKMAFDIPDGNGRCEGSFRVTGQNTQSNVWGEWLLTCPNDLRAAGVFEVTTSSGTGVGKDNRGNAVSFTLGEIVRQ